MQKKLVLQAILSILLMGIFFSSKESSAQTISFAVPSGGCYQSHCEGGNFAQSLTSPPLTSVATPAEIVGTGTAMAGGSGSGLGCTSNLTIVACVYGSTTSSTGVLAIYDKNGNFINNGTSWTTTVFNGQVQSNAPIIFADGGIAAADSGVVAYLPAGTSTWLQATPKNLTTTASLSGNTISPVLVGSNILAIAENCPASSPANTCGFATFVMNTTTGQPTQVGYDPMIIGGSQWSTFNTPVVDNSRSPARVYVVASGPCSGTCLINTARQGALLAYDVTTSGTGAGTVAGPYVIDYFPGPSGASPVLLTNFTGSDGTHSYTGNALFFDGLAHDSSAPTASTACAPTDGTTAGISTGIQYSACFYGVIDTTLSGSGIGHRIWKDIFPSDQFQIGAGLDPRGGLWIFPIAGSLSSPRNTNICTNGSTSGPFDNCLIELSPSTGSLIGSAINLTPIIIGWDEGSAHPDDLVADNDVYSPSSDITVSTNGTLGQSGYKVYLTVGAIDSGRPNPRAVNIDVTAYDPASTATSFTPIVNWVTPQGGDFSSATLGQFSTIQFTDANGNNHNRTVFSGASFGPYFFGY